MLRNYLVTAFRNIRRHKAYSAINISGLMIGLACSFFIVLWVQDEMRYDTSLDEIDQVYRVMRHANLGGTVGTSSSMTKPLGDVLDEAYPEITRTVLMSWEINMVHTHENQAFRSEGRYFGSDFSRYSSFLYWLEIRQQLCWIRNRSRYPNHSQNGTLVTTGV